MQVARNVVAHSHVGEIIAPADLVDVHVRPSPLRQEKKHFRLAAGLTVAEMVEDCAFRAGLHPEISALHVSLNGHAIPRANWSRIRVKSGVNVNIVAVPRGKAIGKIFGAIIALVAAVVAPYLAGPAFLGFQAGTTAFSVATGLIGAGLTMAGSMIVNALFPPAKPVSQVDNTKTLYSIGGAQNEATQYGSIPATFGTHRISPPYAANPYTEIVGDDQYLRLLFCVGYGPISMSDIKIGETPISKFDGVTMEVIENHIATPPTLYTQPVYEEDVSVLMEFADSWTTRTTADNIQEISVDISFPNGVYKFQSSNGKKVNYTVSVEMQYAIAGSGAWAPAEVVTVTANSAQALRRSVLWRVPSGKYDVRVRKSSSDNSTSDQVSEAVYFSTLRGRRKVAAINFSKPLSVIAMRIKATNELSGVVDKLNLLAKPRIRAWNGTAWVNAQFSSNPADHFRHVLQGSANARPVADALIDLDGLQEWHDFCQSKGFVFDYVATSQLSVYDQLQQIAAAGRAAVSLRDGKWGVVWDVEDSPIVQHFTPRNSWSFSSVRAYADLPHGFRVAFINKDNGYLNDERVVYDDGYTEANATKFEGMDFPGVVDKDLIWKHGRYHLAQLRLQRETYTLSTDFENLVCTRGDRVRVNHDTVLWGLGAGRVSFVSSSPDTVVIDDTFPMEAGKTYSMRFRLEDGSSVVRQVAGIAGDFKTFTLVGSGVLPMRGDLALFGENGLDSVILRVKGITAQNDLSAKIELVDDAPGILLADKGDIPPFETGIAPLVDYRAYAPQQLTYIETIWTKASGQSTLKLNWLAPSVGSVSSYIVQYALKGSDNWNPSATAAGTSFELNGLDVGVYDVRVRAVFANGQLSDWVSETMVAAIFANDPDDVKGFRISVAGDTATLQWDDPQNQAVGYYQIRFSPLTSGVTWQTASQLRDNAVGTSVQVSAMVGTYLIKAVTYSGRVSANPAVISTTVDPLTSFNDVEAMQDAPSFTGTKTDVYAVGGQLRLKSGGDVFDLSDFLAPPDFFLSGGGFPSQGMYEFANIIDLGQVFTSRVSAEVLAYGELTSEEVFSRPDWFGPPDFFGEASGSLWDVTVEISTTNDNPAGTPVWSDWSELVTADISARGYRFRAKLQSLQFDVTPVVTGLAVTVDMPDRVLAENDLTVSTDGRTVSFTPPYFALSGVSISAQGLQTGDYYQITGKGANGFTIIFRNAAGTAVARSFDYVAKGYGTIQ
ncbi:host specificity factor TipJ family phage tail protein [Rhizobium sp. BE258]|uniref:host specificity factor TipJ family phage tail protein n=1 Tax=Rhizobium sp. BE258 TaxID=2817722 RepID=UPI0028629C7F|nr:host specificity factor TipJ family phage tail protein [Rhizobium sp. BE258]MDR7147142.1 sulfur carrier protein ThiS [Rhizobium sp. BE258]